MPTRLALTSFLGLSLMILASSAMGEAISIPTAPPVVVQTIPQSGSTGVDPALSEIKVVFSKDMMDQGWSWVSMSKETFPETAGKPRYLKDRRTCVLPVKLAPGKTYAIGINDRKFTNFKDTQGRPAAPYLLVFETGK